MKYLLIILVVCSFAATGRDMMCDKIGYLSTDCLRADVVPFELKDKEVAMKSAETSKTYENNNTKTLVINEAKETDGVIIKTWWEDSE